MELDFVQKLQVCLPPWSSAGGFAWEAIGKAEGHTFQSEKRAQKTVNAAERERFTNSNGKRTSYQFISSSPKLVFSWEYFMESKIAMHLRNLNHSSQASASEITVNRERNKRLGSSSPFRRAGEQFLHRRFGCEQFGTNPWAIQAIYSKFWLPHSLWLESRAKLQFQEKHHNMKISLSAIMITVNQHNQDFSTINPPVCGFPLQCQLPGISLGPNN